VEVLQYSLRKLVAGIPLILGVTFVSFLLMVYFGPDQTYELLGKNPTPEQIAEIRHQLGYDKPFLVRYADYLRELATLEFGHSNSTGEKVSALLGRTIPVSLMLILPGFLLGNLIAIVLALVAANYRSGWVDKTIMGFSVIGMSISYLIVIIAFQVIFSSSHGLGIFPVRGWNVHSFADYVDYIAVPTMATVFVALGYNTRFYRSVIVEELTRDHVRTARAKGLAEWTVLRRHALRLALPSILTGIGLQLGSLLSGAVLTETIFSWPGIGQLVVDRVLARDYPVVQGVILVSALLVVLVNLATDVANVYLAPRITYD